MTISLSLETQRLLEEQMKKHGFSSPDDAVRSALEKLDQSESEYIEDLDPQTQVAIAEGLAQDARGEGRPWEEVRAELTARFIKK
jgi:Arc/MetJ-type ribon-helix-helix transcriptional regulator